jgi:hypothetical protein
MCKQTFHSINSEEERLAEHEQRKKTYAGYDDGKPGVTVCDDCFHLAMGAVQ